jgi:LuxR family maltose regulon positive regulatory protein
VLMAEVAYERNNVTYATELLRDNMRVLGTSEIWSEIYLSGYHVATAIAIAAGDEVSATALLDQALAVAADKGLSRLRDCVLAQRIGFLAASGRLSEADHLCAPDMLPSPDDGDERTWQDREAVVFAQARLAIAKGRPGDLLDALASVHAAAKAQDRHRSVLQAQLLRALALRAAGDQAGAIDALVPALEWGAIEGMVRLFIDEGQPMADLLRALPRTSGPVSLPSGVVRYAERLLSEFGDLQRSPETERLRQLLTARETQILRELSRGASNKGIARTLDISEDGIKFHLKNVFRKLGVNSRVMALTVAQKLDLL